MDIRYFEFFSAVAQYGSINKAAQALYISQPHLSHIIKDIEAEVGMPLFRRTKLGVTLTEEGSRFLEHSQVILKEMENLKQITRKPRPDKERLTVSMTKFSHTMESFNEICGKNQQRDHFTYRLNEGTTVDVIEDVASGFSDVGVIHFAQHEQEHLMRSLEEKSLTFTHIATLAPHIVISKDHELIKKNLPVTLEALRGYGFVRYTGQYEDFIYNIAAENKQMDLNSSNRITYVYGRSALMHLISVSNFYTIGIQGFSTQDSMYRCLSIPIKGCTERLEFGVITRGGSVLSDSERQFIEDVAARYKALQGIE